MSTSGRFGKLATTLGLCLAAALTAGCEKKIDAVCAEKCTKAADATKCTASGATAEATAEERGCESQFEDYVSCAETNAVCTNGALVATTPCATEIKALSACVQ